MELMNDSITAIINNYHKLFNQFENYSRIAENSHKNLLYTFFDYVKKKQETTNFNCRNLQFCTVIFNFACSISIKLQLK